MSMSNVIKNYFRVLEVFTFLNVETLKSRIDMKQKISDIELVTLNLTAEFMLINNEFVV